MFILVMLDLPAAFDTIDHCIHVDRLASFGLGGNVLNWVHSYLTNRTQSVSINLTSETVNLEFGVPKVQYLVYFCKLYIILISFAGMVLIVICTPTIPKCMCLWSLLNCQLKSVD